MACQLQRTTPKGSDGDEESLTFSQILREGNPNARTPPSPSSSSKASPPSSAGQSGIPLCRAESASTAASASTAHSLLLGSLHTWVGGDSPSSSPKGSTKGMHALRREDSRSL